MSENNVITIYNTIDPKTQLEILRELAMAKDCITNAQHYLFVSDNKRDAFYNDFWEALDFAYTAINEAEFSLYDTASERESEK